MPGSSPTNGEELATRDFHLTVARMLRELGCTYEQLLSRVDQRQLDRAVFVLDQLTAADGGSTLGDLSSDLERIEREYPSDRITGAPHHYVLNGDHSECLCGGHQVECEIWNDPHWHHPASICGIARTLCNHLPRHRYGQPCDSYH